MFQNVKLSQNQVIALGITLAIIAGLYAAARIRRPVELRSSTGRWASPSWEASVTG